MAKKPVCDYENYDGVKYEEDKAMHRKMAQNNATCLNFKGHCFKDCANRDIKCDECFKFSEFIETKSK
jgi:hypothetical protein